MRGLGSATSKSRLAWALAAVLCLVGAAPRARAAEFSVESVTVGQAYRIRGRDGLFSVPRSRVTQLLFLSATDLIGAGDEASVPRDLSLSLNFSLDHDFGIETASLDPNDPGRFVPLLRRTEVGLLTGQLTGRFGLDPCVSFGLGRMILLDPAGFVAMDGLEVALRVGRVLEVGLAAGFELVPDVRLSVADFSPEGVAWGDRSGYPNEVHPEVRSPRPRPVLVTSLGIRIPGAGSITLSYRSTWQDHRFGAVSLERLGMGLDVSGPDRPVSVRIRSAFDLVWLRFAEIDAEVEVTPGRTVGLGVRYLHLVPLFDTASIFNVFDSDPHDEVGLFVNLGRPLASPLNLSAGSFVRLTDVPDDEPDDDRRLSDLGGWIALSARLGIVDVSLTSRGSGGQSGTLAGTRLQVSARLLDGRLVPVLGIGLWFWDDPLRREHHGLTTGGSAMVSWRVARPLAAVIGLDVYDNRVSGTGLSATMRLVVEL
jgi:hypothetical protein